MMVARKTNPLLLTVFTIFLSAFSVLLFLEIDRAIAWISSSSWKHNHNHVRHAFVSQQARKSKTTVVNFGATKPDENPTEDNTASIEDDWMIDKRKNPSQYQQQEDPVEPTALEESLFEQHAALESYISETDIDRRPENRTPESSTETITGKDHRGQNDKRKNEDTSSVTRSTPFFLRSIPHSLKSKGNTNQGLNINTSQKTAEKPRVIESKEEHSQSDVPVPFFLRPKGSNILEPETHKDPNPPSSSRSIPHFLMPKHQRNHQSTTTVKTENIEKHAVQKSGKEPTHVDKSMRDHEIRDRTQSSSVKNPKCAPIDQAIYNFNKNLVGVLYAAISSFYPMSSQSEQKQDPSLALLGTEYNEEAAPKEILRYEKFYIFETVARIPYFAYLSVLHLRESLGDRGFPPGSLIEGFGGTKPDEREDRKEQSRKRIETMRTHYAQADNELHHLLIMEALGGNSRGIDRFVAHSLAFFYYWFVVLVFFWNEQAAYHLNEVVEDHAYRTYDEVSSTVHCITQC